MMTFDEWCKDFNPGDNESWTTDLREAFEAGWNYCAYERTDMTYKEYHSAQE